MRWLYTWTSSDGQYQNQTEYILGSQRCRRSIQSAKTRLEADYGSDHELLIAKFRLKLKKVGKTTRLFRCVCVCVCVLVAQLCPPLCDPRDCNLPGSSVHGILQARILEQGAILFCRESFQLWDGSPVLQADSLPSEPPEKPLGMWGVVSLKSISWKELDL